MSTDGMDGRDLVVVGGSAGGIEALCAVLAGLSPQLPAAVLVVLHMPPAANGELPAVLNRCGPLPAAAARDGEPLLPGRVYVAVPDRHLLVRKDAILLSRGPKQNRTRPAIDALFRSAARWRGARTVGVILSGALDDGAAGLAAIAASGGAVVVQDPGEALFGGMPKAAAAIVPDARGGTAARLGPIITELVCQPVGRSLGSAPDPVLIKEVEMAESERIDYDDALPGRPVAVSCPDCSGGMHVVEAGAALHYLCHIGHAWAPQSLIAAQREKIEQALWTAVSILEEQAHIHQQLADRAARGAAMLTKSHQLAAADEILKAAQVIRKHFPELLPGV